MLEKIDNNQVPGILKESSPKQPDPSRVPASNEGDASLQVSYDSLIEQAKQIPPEETNIVQQARQLLLSGQLESPENIRAAAENIVRFGI
jgi:hypothetical protein